MTALANNPALANLVNLDLGDLSRYGRIPNAIGAEALAALGASEHLNRLERLRLAGLPSIDDEALRVLLAWEGLPRLRALDLMDTGITDFGVCLLARSPFASRLEELSLSCTVARDYTRNLADEAALALAQSPHLRRLRYLRLHLPQASRRAARALRQRFGQGVSLT
jgi:hypothetical protein